MADYIPVESCEDRRLYRIRSRNLIVGVYREDRKGFIGLRDKFGNVYPFTEYHYDTGAPYGTVKPQEELLELLPDSIPLNEGFSGCRLCKKAVRCVPGEVTYRPGETPQQVPCAYNEHVDPTDCPASAEKHFSVFWQNDALAQWLEAMEYKYVREKSRLEKKI